MDTTRMASAQQRRRARERIGVDPKCEELAKHFLSDVAGSNHEHVEDLARIIQVRIEGYLAHFDVPLTAIQQSIRDGTFGVKSSDPDAALAAPPVGGT